MIYRDINTIRFFDGIRLFESLDQVSNECRPAHLLDNAGVEFYDDKGLFVKKPSVGVIGIGGISFDLEKGSGQTVCLRNSAAEVTIHELSEIFEPLQAFGGYMSYLNSGDHSEDAMVRVLKKHQHFSPLHLSYINFAIFGISSLVENEFNCQRDMMHLARITEARTSVQDRPPVIVLHPDYLEFYRTVYQSARKARAAVVQPKGVSKKDHLESVNALYPAAKSTGLVISITLRNLLRLVAMIDDQGKETEMKRVLAMVNDISHRLWPDFFKKTSSYGYRYPAHW